MIPGVTVLKQEERSTFDEALQRVVYFRTWWKYKGHGPFYDDAPKDGWTAAAFEQRVQPHVNQLTQLGL